VKPGRHLEHRDGFEIQQLAQDEGDAYRKSEEGQVTDPEKNPREPPYMVIKRL
jgi:hypothetical protein